MQEPLGTITRPVSALRVVDLNNSEPQYLVSWPFACIQTSGGILPNLMTSQLRDSGCLTRGHLTEKLVLICAKVASFLPSPLVKNTLNYL